MQSAKQVQFLDENDKPFHSEPVLWQQKLVLDKTWGTRFKVRYIDGKAKTTVSVDLNDDLAVRPDTLTTQVVVVTEVAVAAPEAATETAQPMAQPTSRPTSTPTKGPVAATAQTDLVVYYDSVSLTLLNNTKTSLNLTSVNFKYGEKYLGAARWGKVVPVPINAFPAGQCLQILGVAEPLIKPEVCSFVRSIMQFPPDRLFWTQDDFDVLNGDKVLVTCKKGAGRCEVPWS